MKVKQLFLVALVPLIVAPATATADEITLNQAIGGAHKIDANGTYNLDAGRTLVRVVLVARLQGTTQESSTFVPAANNKWNGTLLLVAGKYTVWAELHSTDGTSTFVKKSNEIKDVTVTNP